MLPDGIRSLNVVERPSFLDDMPVRGKKTKSIVNLAEKLRSLRPTEAVVYSIGEYCEVFGVENGDLKRSTSYTRWVLKNRCGLNKVRFYQDDQLGKIFFWLNKV